MTEQSIWRLNRRTVICEHCHSVYLADPAAPPAACPHCLRDVLDPIEGDADQLHLSHEPELMVPFAISPETAAERAVTLKNGIPFPSRDLNTAILYQRLVKVYLPLWLVDANTRATWQAEVGFHYEVVSHREQYAGGSWRTQEVKETRANWEPRVGRMERHYDNITSPALEGFASLKRHVGGFDTSTAVAYDPTSVGDALLQTPDRDPEAAWPEALPGFLQVAADEVRRAAEADEIREFRWTMQYKDRHWTQLLVPLYATYYLNDEDQPRQIWINGQTGQVWGERRASMQRARRLTFILAGTALAIFIFSVLVMLVALAAPPVIVLGIFGIVLAIGFGGGAVIPLVRVTRFNNRQPRS